jgi:hypothetical protein
VKQKYIDERTGVWFIFGEHADGSVDISDGDNDVFEHIARELAENLCAEQAKFREALYALVAGEVLPGKPKVGGLDCGVDLETGKGVCVCGRCSAHNTQHTHSEQP